MNVANTLCECSYDMMFSNWLLMYLEDVEVKNLFTNMLRWLRPDGYFFFRESCYHSSGVVMHELFDLLNVCKRLEDLGTFYRAMLRRARYCHGKSSVRPSVYLSVTLRYCDHTGWNFRASCYQVFKVLKLFRFSTDRN